MLSSRQLDDVPRLKTGDLIVVLLDNDAVVDAYVLFTDSVYVEVRVISTGVSYQLLGEEGVTWARGHAGPDVDALRAAAALQ